jgi:hypothetical protein
MGILEMVCEVMTQFVGNYLKAQSVNLKLTLKGIVSKFEISSSKI